MAVIGLGIDIIEVSRFDSNNLDKLSKRILTPQELTHFNSSKKQVSYLAKRFAVKEAAAKALGTGISEKISFQNFNIYNNDLGKPVLELSGEAKALSLKKNIISNHVSISDEKHYAVAIVIFEGNK